MRILVFSDTHMQLEGCIQTIENIIGVDMIIHAGDHMSDAKNLSQIFPDIPVKYVAGNCDISFSENELVTEIEGSRIFITHGHLYNVKNENTYQTLKNKGTELGCDIVVFGHTHIPYNENCGNIILLNPGSAKYTKTYGVIEIENNKLKSAVLDMNLR